MQNFDSVLNRQLSSILALKTRLIDVIIGEREYVWKPIHFIDNEHNDVYDL